MVGVTPDLVCLAKAIGGGVSTAAIGGSVEVMSLIADGRYEQVGTFNGNPLAMASARAMLTEVLTPASYAHLDRLRDRMAAGLQEVIDVHDLPWRVVTAGAKGCVSFLPDPIHDFRDFLRLDGRYGQAHWLVQANGGAFLPPWGKVEQWLVSVQHDDADVDRFVGNVDRLAALLTAGPQGR
jgi:glutamate-1-semialdehyde 2,1-aminomutase